MEFYAVYIISADGRPMLTEVYSQNKALPDDVVSAGLLQALQNFNENAENKASVTTRVESQVEISGLTYSFKRYGDFTVVLVEKLLENRDEIIDQIGFKFLRQFGDSDLINWKGNTERFSEFKKTLGDILTTGEMPSLDNTQKQLKALTTVDIFDLDKNVQPVALAMLVFQKATVNEISEEINQTNESTKELLEELVQIGYLTHERADGQIYYKSMENS